MAGEKREKNASRGKGRPFAKGNKGGGRKPLPEDIRAARSMATEEMLRTIIEVRMMTTGEVKKLDLDKVPLGKRAVISAYAKNDYRGIREYEDRLFGRPQESVSISGEDGKPIIPQKVVFEVVEAKHEPDNTDSKAVSGDQ